MSTKVYSVLNDNINSEIVPISNDSVHTNSGSVSDSDESFKVLSDLKDDINDITKISVDSANSTSPLTETILPQISSKKSSKISINNNDCVYNFIKTDRNEIDLNDNVIEYTVLTCDFNNGISIRLRGFLILILR